MPHYKKRGSNLDKWLSPYLTEIYQKLIKYSTEYTQLFIEWGSKCKLPSDLLVFHHGLTLVMFQDIFQKSRAYVRYEQKKANFSIFVYLGQIKYGTILHYITSILLLIFWYYLLALVANFRKQTHLERYVPVMRDMLSFG